MLAVALAGVGSALALGPNLQIDEQRKVIPGIAHDGPAPTATPTPTPTVTPTPQPTPTPVPTVPTSWPAQLTASEMRELYAYAGVPAAWVEPLLTIAWCESRYRPNAQGDGSGSLGLHQLWSGWFSRAGYSTSQWADPVVNTKVALYVREQLGRFGGSGGWTCANIHGIY